MLSVLKAAVALLCVALAVGCDNDARPLLVSRESDRFSFTRFLDSVGSFPYEADEKKRTHVVQGFGRLRPGMSMDEVARHIGHPDAEMLHSMPGEAGEKLAYTTWAYYLRRHEREKFKESFDQAVFLHFKPGGEMYWADAGSVPGLQALGSPDLLNR